MTSIATLMEVFTLNTRPITMRARDNCFVTFCDLKAPDYLGHANITSPRVTVWLAISDISAAYMTEWFNVSL